MLPATSVRLDDIRRPVGDRLTEVERTLIGMIPSGFESMDDVAEYLFARSGKLFRPTLVLLSDALGGDGSVNAVRLAAIVELLHVATLVHDDAVDHSARRRGMPTVNDRWTHQVAIIAGDYLYSRAVIEITALGELEPIAILANTANQMTIGEMRQLVLHDGLDFTRADYDRLCECKTASLISAACELGAMSGAPEHRDALRAYGYHLGMAFQMVDDLLDYASPEEVTGKPGGQDLREHKVTLPLIAALERMDEAGREDVERLFADPDPDDDAVTRVVDLVARFGGLEEARAEAREEADRARARLDGLPDGEPAAALRLAVDYVVDRVR
ncbi:MAG: polyprenyl synthetase family protein [Gemmatimonadota bacterium]|nr:polyprenyl synthetase family protein [Gemmatimonadota bacterium]